MAYLTWRNDLNTGIEVIDMQHRRIVEMINQLDETQGQDRAAVGVVIEALVDYTVSHFAFEESLMEEAGYPFSRAHKRIHDLFIKRVYDYRARYAVGEDVAGELQDLLSRWLFSHIKEEDASYVGAVRMQMQSLAGDRSSGGWLSRSMKRFFGRSEAA
ncbi:bacteriohemerythrin [Azotobacter beijerinckii]|uniref:bacteriohemerythrin n=1 Tax=Azotobacter beijerinckii TaxID=170623 RepID=UPI00295526BF|nr:bacteriohemerythrin [Azotobacter beijerinckii]MDV7212464.1 bacteriohemerythrin [Azotobacter beijerinckii]